jgi:hypothetical protein
MAVFHCYGHIAGDQQSVTAADGNVVILPVASDPGLYRTEVESGDNVQPKFDVSIQTFNDAQDLSVGIVFSAATHRKTINQTGPAGLGLECSLENQRLIPIPTLALIAACWRNLAVSPLLPVENPAETAARVDARHAAPIDGACSGDHGRGMTVSDETVIVDRGIGVCVHRVAVSLFILKFNGLTIFHLKPFSPE